MDSSDVTQLIILLILLGLSAFFSSAETALTTVNKIRIRSLAEDGNKRAKTVLKITDDSGKMLSAIPVSYTHLCKEHAYDQMRDNTNDYKIQRVLNGNQKRWICQYLRKIL